MAGNASLIAKHLAAPRHRLPPLPSIRDLLKLYKIRAAKQLSQNFLMDSKLSSKIVRCGGRVRDCHVCEVGPGPGRITRSIIEQNASIVTVIEKDKRFLPSLELLRDSCAGKVNIHLGDVLNFNMENTFSKEYASNGWDDKIPKIRLIGNLPFNISTPLIIRWLKDISLQRNAWVHGRVPMTLTFQYEVAQRIDSLPGQAQRSRLSIMCQNWCHVHHKFTIPGRAFVPKPDIDVGVVTFTPRIQPQIPLEFDLVEKVVRCIFAFRQKHCKRGAELLFPKIWREKLVDKMFAIADIDPTSICWQLTVPEFNRLCHAYDAILKQEPRLRKFNIADESLFIVNEDFDIFDDVKKTNEDLEE